MRRIVVASLVSGLALMSTAWAQVGVSLQFSQPGVFGRVDIGQFPQPQVIVPTPVIIQPAPVGVPPPEPFYLWVPLDHRKHWDHYCHQYNACGHPVYFVNHAWYHDHVMAHREHVQERHEEAHHDHGRGEDEREHGRGREDERGRGHD